MRHVGFVAHGLNRVNHVASIFFQRIVHAGFKVRLGTVVVNSEATTHVKVFQPSAATGELGIDASCFIEGRFDLTDIRDLAAQMEMQQREAVFHPTLLEFIKSHQNFVGSQTELRTIPARGLPTACSSRRQFHSHSDLRSDIEFLCVLQNQFQFRVLFYDRNYVPANLLSQQRHFDELGVLETVADDGRLSLGHRHNGQEFRLAACLETESKFTPVLDDLLNDLSLLIHLDRVNAGVVPFVAVFLDRIAERFVQNSKAIANDSVETQQHRNIQPSHLKSLDQFFQVHGPGRIAIRMYEDVPVGAN